MHRCVTCPPCSVLRARGGRSGAPPPGPAGSARRGPSTSATGKDPACVQRIRRRCRPHEPPDDGTPGAVDSHLERRSDALLRLRGKCCTARLTLRKIRLRRSPASELRAPSIRTHSCVGHCDEVPCPVWARSGFVGRRELAERVVCARCLRAPRHDHPTLKAARGVGRGSPAHQHHSGRER